MKSMTVLMMLMIFITSHPSSAQAKDDYLTKSRKQKTAAWILLGGGWAVGTTGLIVGLHGLADVNTGQPDKVNNNIGNGGLLVLTGGAAMLTSIPFFVSAGKNNRKAMSLSFINQQEPALVRNITGNKYTPSICIKFNL